MARYVITGMKPNSPVCYYVSSHGIVTSNPDWVYVTNSLKDAEEERAYRAVACPLYSWSVEKLPRGHVSNALLRAVPVDVSEEANRAAYDRIQKGSPGLFAPYMADVDYTRPISATARTL